VNRICVYCGSSSGANGIYVEAAQKLGRALAERDLTLVYGGGKIGTMGTVAEAALDAGGEVIGVIPAALAEHKLALTRVTELHIVDSMHERKALMAELSDGFVALPGGFGTFEELFEILTWAQLNFHTKPVGLLNVNGYYDRLIDFLDHAASEGFVKPVHRDMLLVADDAKMLLQAFATYRAPQIIKW
jgi:uncharacterized protein (TIGR00730 family)